MQKKERADRTSLKGKQRLVRTIEINRSGNWREDTHTHTHAQSKKRGRMQHPAFVSSACGCAHNRHTHTHKHTHTSGCHNSSASHKKKKERKRGGEASCLYQHKTNNKHSLVCRVTSRRSAARCRFGLRQHTNEFI